MFELLCYAAMTIAILVLRHEQDTFAHGTQIDELPIELPVVIELVKPKYKRPAAKSFAATASCVVVVDTIAPGWDLDRNGNPLRGAALKGRKRKLGISDGD